MNNKLKAIMWTVALAAGLALAAAGPCTAQLPATDLGVLAGRDISHAAAINNSGQIAGYCANLVWDDMEGDWVEDGNTDLPFVWQNGTMTPLPLLAGYIAGFVEAINSSGQIVGACWTADWSTQGCLWTRTDSGWTVAGLGVPAGCTGSWARMISDAGQIVLQGRIEEWPWSRDYFRDSQGNETLLQDSTGNLLFPCQMNGSGQIVAWVGNNSGMALWNDGAVTDLVSFPGFDAWINDLGQVVGAFSDHQADGTWVNKNFIYLPEAAYGLPAGLNKWPVSEMGGYFGGINNTGQVLLVASPVSDGAGYFTTDFKVIQLGGSVVYQFTVPGDTSFQAPHAMNGKGQVVGYFSTADYGMASFFADPVTGFTLLGSLGGPTSWPGGLNDSGMIFGDSMLADEKAHACIWWQLTAYAALIQQPINADGSSTFAAKRGVVPVKFTLTAAGTPTCALPAATIAVSRVGGTSPGPIDEATYAMAADSGSNFRISDCQYVYNLSLKSLSAGTYRVEILIAGKVVGSATFELK